MFKIQCKQTAEFAILVPTLTSESYFKGVYMCSNDDAYLEVEIVKVLNVSFTTLHTRHEDL